MPAMQDQIRGWKRQNFAIHNGSIKDSGEATLSLTETNGTVRLPVLTYFLDLDVKGTNFDHQVSERASNIDLRYPFPSFYVL